MVDVEVDYEEEVEVRVAPEAAFALLADVYRSGIHFPGVADLTPVGGDGRWRWAMEEKGFGPVKVKAVYDAVYTASQGDMRVDWKPAPGRNDMESFGSWEIRPAGDCTCLVFRARTIAHIPAPRLMAKMVDAFVREELLELKKKYVAAIAATLAADAA
jgi:hypothetical protein